MSKGSDFHGDGAIAENTRSPNEDFRSRKVVEQEVGVCLKNEVGE